MFGVALEISTLPLAPVPPVVLRLPPMLSPKPVVLPAIAVKSPFAPVPLPPVVMTVVVSVEINPEPPEPKNETNVISPPTPLAAVLLDVRAATAEPSRSIEPPTALAPVMVIVVAVFVNAAPAIITMSPALPAADAVEIDVIGVAAKIARPATREMPPGAAIEPLRLMSSCDATDRLAAVVAGRST